MQPVTTDPIVFSSAWFARHQRMLIGLLRTPVIGRELRDVLAIRKHDVGFDRRIVEIGPHYYVVNEDGTSTMDCRTTPKFARRLRYQLDGLWRAAHAWDQCVANPLLPALNVGFDSLTAYPDPGSPGTTTCDGSAYRAGVDEAFGTVRNGSGTGAYALATTDTTPELAASTTSNQFARLQRGLFGFDTSALGASAVLSAAVLSQWFTGVSTGLGDTTVEVTAGPTAANTTLASGDYQTIGRTSYATGVSISAITTGAYTDFTFDATGRAAVQKTGITKLATQLGWDLSGSFGGSWSASATTAGTVSFADQTGSSNDPKLEITYTVPGILLVKN